MMKILKNRISVILAIGLLFIPLKGKAGLFNASEFVLNNGLRVVVVENHKAPLIKHMMWYLAGAADEKRGKGGSAHLLEHLMFRGSKNVKDGKFDQFMTENGAESNAFTSHDMTVYHQFADISRLEALMALEADRMQNLKFSDKAFKAEQKIVFQERKQVVENNPAAPFYERLNLMLWGNLPYGHPVTGLSEEIMELSADDVYRFYDEHYAPNNAILVLVGDIEPAIAKKLAEKYYGSIPPKIIRPKNRDTVNAFFKEKLEMKLPLVTTPKLVYKYILPSSGNLNTNMYAYMLLAEYLGGGKTSALYRELVVNGKLASSVSASFDYFSKSNDVFSINVIPNSDVALINVNVAVRLAMSQAIKELNLEELEKLKTKMVSDLVFANDNPEDAAYWLGTMLAYGFSLEQAQNYAKNIKAVSLEEISAAAQDVLLKSSLVEGVLLPENKKKGDKNSD